MYRIKGFVGCEVIRNGDCGFTKHIGHNGIQCHIADGKRILKPIFLAAFHKANAKQITDPLGIFHIILVSLYSLYPFGIGNNDTDTTTLQDVEYGNPVLSGRFHANIVTIVFQKPIRKPVEF